MIRFSILLFALWHSADVASASRSSIKAIAANSGAILSSDRSPRREDKPPEHDRKGGEGLLSELSNSLVALEAQRVHLAIHSNSKAPTVVQGALIFLAVAVVAASIASFVIFGRG